MTNEAAPQKDSSAVPVLTDDEINESVKFINEKANEHIYKGYIEIGKHILEKFFNDDIELASSRNPRKPASFNKLCENEKLIVHPNRLALMVRVASQEKYLEKEGVNSEPLSYTHKAALVKLSNDKNKIKLIQECIDKGLSTKEFEDIVSKKYKKQSGGKSISLIKTAQINIKKIDSAIKKVNEYDLNISDDDFSKLSESKLVALKKHLNDLKRKAKKAAENSDKISSNCDDLLNKLESAVKEKKTKQKKKDSKSK